MLPTVEDILANIIAQQAKANAELTARGLRMEQEISAQRIRIDALEAEIRKHGGIAEERARHENE